MRIIDEDALYLLKRNVEYKMGFSLKAPNNFEALISNVFKVTGEKLSLSTIKRIWGYVNESNIPRLSTLSILSRFLGYRDYDDFCEKKHIYTTADSEFISQEGEQIKDLNVGDELTLEWKPDRFCRIKYEQEDTFRVINAINCKLMIGDTFSSSFIAAGHPMFVTNLIRNGNKLNDYIAGRKSGLQTVNVKHFKNNDKNN